MRRFKNLTRLIGICGNAQHGKNTLAEMLDINIESRVRYYSFAFAIKQGADTLLESYQVDDKLSTDNILGITNREIYQRFGSAIRHEFGDDIFIRILDNLLLKDCSTAVITDVRFANEADWILNNFGTLIHIVRPQVLLLIHESELFPARFKGYSRYHTHAHSIIEVDNSGTLDNLREKTIAILAKCDTCEVIEQRYKKIGLDIAAKNLDMEPEPDQPSFTDMELYEKL